MPVLEHIHYPSWKKKGVAVSVLRDDLIHPYISGNKWRKLKYNLVDFKNSGKAVLVTFGGNYSNHLLATAAASFEYGFLSIGIVRGQRIENPYLNFAESNGMKLHFISKSDYRNKHDPFVLSKICNDLLCKGWINDPNEIFILPEGGSNPAGVRGTSEITNDIKENFDWVACACGTGTTIAGLSQNLSGNQKAIGISVLKAKGYLEQEIINLGGIQNKIILNENYHFGGYAKKNKTLENFCDEFISDTGIPIEPVYTGKLFFAIDDLIKNNYLKSGEKVTVIHTGGIFKFVGSQHPIH